MKDTYTARILDNGLTVLLKENHSVPVISHRVWYRVGSRNEAPGKTGISHWVEHMMFRGSKRFPAQEAVREIHRNGGELNAFTGFDATSYYETMPADRIGAALEIEADRMVNALFDPADIESERKVVLTERAGGMGGELSRFTSSLQKAVFPSHPYGREVIGRSADLLSLTRDDLNEHYRTWYAPNNAVVTAAGDFETEEMFRRIEAAYGSIPARPVPAADIAPEGPIRGPLKVEAHGPCEFTDLRICWHVPGAGDPAIPAFALLCGILAGPDPMQFSENTVFPNRSTRLFRKLTAEGMAADITMEYTPTIDPFFLGLSVLVSPGTTADEVSDVIFGELESIANRGVLPEEIQKARKQAKTLYARSAEDAESTAYWLGYSSVFAGPEWYTEYPERLEGVSAEDISRFAGSFLRRDNCVIGVYSSEEE